MNVWDLSTDWTNALNQPSAQVPDSCGNLVWTFLTSNGLTTDPAAFVTFGYFVTDTQYGGFSPQGPELQGWCTAASYSPPSISVNATPNNQDFGPEWPFTWPVGTVLAHPGPDSLAGVSWQSTIRGNVLIELSIADLDPWGTPPNYDGISWALEKNSTVLRQGTVENTGAIQVSEPVRVVPGDMIYVMLGPLSQYYFDSTHLGVRITKQ